MTKTTAVLTELVRPLVQSRLPDCIDARFFNTFEEAFELAPNAEIGWFDMHDQTQMAAAIRAAPKLKWLNSIYAGVDGLPLDLLRQRGTVVTNGAGINAVAISEYVVMGMLSVAKGYREVIRAQDRHEWLSDSPGKMELYGSKALLLGYGAIGKQIEKRLKGFGVDISVVRRSPDANALGPNEWRDRVGEYDWVILAVPATAETDGMIGVAELSAMKATATLINIARGTVVDQRALASALRDEQIAAAFLDVTTPEPLPSDDALWNLPGAHITMHLSGRSQDKMFVRSADRFIQNLDRWERGEAVEPQVDLLLGY